MLYIGGRAALLVLVALLARSGGSATFTESFIAGPQAGGWRTFGNSNLFEWNPAEQNLRVTWDSSQTNSYFHRALGTIVTRADDFQAGFDVVFDDYASGVNPSRPGAMPAAIGFFNLANATHTNFSRSVGINATYGPRNLVEFGFFPEFDIFPPTIAQVVVATNNTWLYNHENLLPMTPGQRFRVTLSYAASSQTLTTTVTNNGVQYGATQVIVVPPTHDFRCDTFSFSSYSEVRGTSSLLAHGTVDNLVLVTPPPPVRNLAGVFSNGLWQVEFSSQSHWVYTLQRSPDFQTWTGVSSPVPGNGGLLRLNDPTPPSGHAAYRVRADRP